MTRLVSAMWVIGMERNILANRSTEPSSLEVILVRLLAKTGQQLGSGGLKDAAVGKFGSNSKTT